MTDRADPRAAVTALASIYETRGDVAAVAGFLDGVRPVAMALVAAAAVRISRKALGTSSSYALMAAAFLASYALDVPFIAILAGCGLLGAALGGRVREPQASRHRRLFGAAFVTLVVALFAGAQVRSWGPSATEAGTSGASLREHGAPPLPAPPERARLLDVAWVNTKAALVTFGGAYTVIPFLREQTVEHHRWLDDRQVVDGLALGETTPGPLISIGIFLTYLAAGLGGAVVGCFFLFLPSFVLVLGLGRYVDRVERLPRAREILWGFSAGTLGLIVALAAQLLPTSVPDLFSACLAIAAFAAVWRLGVSLILVVGAGGALGLLRAFGPALAGTL